MMPNIQIRRYSRPLATGWAGYIEPADLSWIAFIGLDGVPRFYLNRDPATGAVLPDDPAQRAEHIERVRELPEDDCGLATGMAEHHAPGDGGLDLVPGERVFPFGVDSRGG